MTQFQLHCANCDWAEHCDVLRMRDWLQQAGALRRATDPEPELTIELFRRSAGKFLCPDCCEPLTVREISADAEFGDARKCEGCRQPIPAARIAAVPAATLCASCQAKVDRGQPVGEAEYCPHCGGIMVLRKSTSGITRYTSRCGECGRS